jgi:iron complex transport system permease protein
VKNQLDFRARAAILNISFVVLIVILAGVDLASGSVRIPVGQVFSALNGKADNQSWNVIVHVFRLPKLATTILAGVALSVSGLVLQSIFRNPLAGPDSLGIGAGASIGVAVLVLAAGSTSSAFFGTIAAGGYAMLTIASSIGAGLVLALILALSRRFEHGVTLLIIGLLVGYLTGSLVSLLIYFGTPQKVQLYLGWTYGSFSGVTNQELPAFAAAVALGLLLVLRSSKALDAFVLGEEFAKTLGIRVKRERTRLLAASAILAGAVTAFCGPIAFLGIAAPQAAKKLYKSSNHRILLPGTAAVGTVVALLADIVSQAPGGGSILPVNPLLALIGAPIILAMFLRGGNESGTGGGRGRVESGKRRKNG